jgi:hypothetical protein
MPILKIRRDEAIKLIHDRTNGYQIEHMSNEELGIFVSSMGEKNNIQGLLYGCDIKIKEK